MNHQLEQKVVVVTGANGGIGQQYVRQMLHSGVRVIMAVRNKQSGESVVAKILQEYPNAQLELMTVDMSDLGSIKAFALQLKGKISRLDALVHNAGVYYFDNERKTSPDGNELNIAVHLTGPYALTALLFPLLRGTKGSKVISMSSTEHHKAEFNFDDIQMEKDFHKGGNMEAYARSKWATVAFTYALARKLKKAGIDMHAIAAHPGISITGIQHKGSPTIFQKCAIWLFGKLVAAKPEQAAESLTLSFSKGKNGEFYGPTGFKEFNGKAGLVKPDEQATLQESGSKIWAFAEKSSGINFDVI